MLKIAYDKNCRKAELMVSYCHCTLMTENRRRNLRRYSQARFYTLKRHRAVLATTVGMALLCARYNAASLCIVCFYRRLLLLLLLNADTVNAVYSINAAWRVQVVKY